MKLKGRRKSTFISQRGGVVPSTHYQRRAGWIKWLIFQTKYHSFLNSFSPAFFQLFSFPSIYRFIWHRRLWLTRVGGVRVTMVITPVLPWRRRAAKVLRLPTTMTAPQRSSEHSECLIAWSLMQLQSSATVWWTLMRFWQCFFLSILKCLIVTVCYVMYNKYKHYTVSA